MGNVNRGVSVGSNKNIFSFKRRPLIGNTETEQYVFGPEELATQDMFGGGTPNARQMQAFGPQQYTEQTTVPVSPIGSGTQFQGQYGTQALLQINLQTPGN